MCASISAFSAVVGTLPQRSAGELVPAVQPSAASHWAIASSTLSLPSARASQAALPASMVVDGALLPSLVLLSGVLVFSSQAAVRPLQAPAKVRAMARAASSIERFFMSGQSSGVTSHIPPAYRSQRNPARLCSAAVTQSGRGEQDLDQRLLAVWAIAAAFTTYFCMYSFRKPFAAASFEGEALGMQLKVALVLSQVIGYALSKFIGIRLVSETPARRRAWTLIALIGL